MSLLLIGSSATPPPFFASVGNDDFVAKLCCKIIGVFEFFRRELIKIESEYKNVLILRHFFFCACTVYLVSGSAPPNFKSKFAVVYEIRPLDGLSIFRLAQLHIIFFCGQLCCSLTRYERQSITGTQLYRTEHRASYRLGTADSWMSRCKFQTEPWTILTLVRCACWETRLIYTFEIQSVSPAAEAAPHSSLSSCNNF